MVYVNSFEQNFRDAFDESAELPEDYCNLIKKIEDNIWEAVQNKLRDNTVEYLKSNIQDDICAEAAKVAESMISNALAGDDETLRNLFGFSDWYLKHRYIGDHLTQYKLLDMLVERNPQFFSDEKIKQLEADNKALKEQIERINKYKKVLGLAVDGK